MQSVEKTEPLLITDRLQGIQVTERIEPEGFLFQSGFDHQAYSPVDAFVENFARIADAQFNNPKRALFGGSAADFAIRTSALQADFQSPDHPLRIVSVHRRILFGIEFAQLP